MSTRVLQRVIFPTDQDLDVLPLYVEGTQGRLGTTNAGRDASVVQMAGRQRTDQVLDRTSYRVPASSRTSFATYFNAFPASYWRRWTVVQSVRLRVSLRGSGSVLVYKSNAKGNTQRVDSVQLESGTDEPQEFTFELPLTTFGDGGWYWFDVAAGVSDVVLDGAQWEAEVPERSTGSVTIGITTFNRPDDCAAVLGQLAASDSLPGVLKEVVVVDQGTKKVADAEAFPAAERALGGRLRVVDQPNLGGSGGFSRGMHEAVENGSDYVLLLDDDVRSEPEGIVRAVTFADLARTPTIVGGHMFSMYQRSVLHAMGERVQPWRFWWGEVKGTEFDHDLAESGLRTTSWLHRRVDVDYNGWWMCLIPTGVVRQIGMSLPFFIKWDDAEYGLRAKERGVPTVSLPGAAVWHVPWTDKDDTLDWQAYYHERNRFVAALLHSRYPRGGRLVRESMNHQIRHLLSSQYSVVELRIRALEDVLSGPQHLHEELPTKLAEIRALRSQFSDAQVKKDPAAFPMPKRQKLPRKGEDIQLPEGKMPLYLMAARGALKQLLPPKPLSKKHPEAEVAAIDAKWWMLSQFDSAVVTNADGSGAVWYHRDPEKFRELMARSVAVHQKIYRAWDDLARQYRMALPEVAGSAAWQRSLGLADERVDV
ncbi:glycosyltransferase [Georgenia sp. AZ-5]|uniref:glycosyltransferase n=1 Tax=Georgenia sp. AZ-5 TaxID=3367526 RepID=UPI003754B6FB